MPKEDEALDCGIGDVPELVSLVDEAVSLFYGEGEVQIGPLGRWIDTLDDYGSVGLNVA